MKHLIITCAILLSAAMAQAAQISYVWKTKGGKAAIVVKEKGKPNRQVTPYAYYVTDYERKHTITPDFWATLYYGATSPKYDILRVRNAEGLYGLVNMMGEELLPCKYESILHKALDKHGKRAEMYFSVQLPETEGGKTALFRVSSYGAPGWATVFIDGVFESPKYAYTMLRTSASNGWECKKCEYGSDKYVIVWLRGHKGKPARKGLYRLGDDRITVPCEYDYESFSPNSFIDKHSGGKDGGHRNSVYLVDAAKQLVLLVRDSRLCLYDMMARREVWQATRKMDDFRKTEINVLRNSGNSYVTLRYDCVSEIGGIAGGSITDAVTYSVPLDVYGVPLGQRAAMVLMQNSAGKWGLYDAMRHNTLIPMEYDEIDVRHLTNGFFTVRRDGVEHYAYFTRNGEEVVLMDSKTDIMRHAEVVGASGGCRILKHKNGYGLLTPKAADILACTYDTIFPISKPGFDGAFGVYKDGRYGIVYNGALRTPCAYESIGDDGDGMKLMLTQWNVLFDNGEPYSTEVASVYDECLIYYVHPENGKLVGGSSLGRMLAHMDNAGSNVVDVFLKFSHLAKYLGDESLKGYIDYRFGLICMRNCEYEKADMYFRFAAHLYKNPIAIKEYDALHAACEQRIAAAEDEYQRKELERQAAQLEEEERKRAKRQAWLDIIGAVGEAAGNVAQVLGSGVPTSSQASSSSSSRHSSVSGAYSFHSSSASSPRSSSAVSQQKPTSQQESVASSKITLGQMNALRTAYDEYAKLLMDMYYGFTAFNMRDAERYKSSMKTIRQRCLADGKQFVQSEWETWNYSARPPKK